MPAVFIYCRVHPATWMAVGWFGGFLSGDPRLRPAGKFQGVLLSGNFNSPQFDRAVSFFLRVFFARELNFSRWGLINGY